MSTVKSLSKLRLANYVLLACSIVMGVLVDLNGQYPYLGPRASNILTILVLSAGIFTALKLLLTDPGRKLVPILSLILYAAMLAPALMP